MKSWLTKAQTEWCYNYHDPEFPYRCNAQFYPTPDEQYRFLRAYLMHNPTFKASSASASNPPTPQLAPLHSSGSSTALAATAAPTSISAFMLDSRLPSGKGGYEEREAQNERQIEEEAKRLMAETRLWRLANSAMWVAWGIVQAHVPGLPDFDNDGNEKSGENPSEGASPMGSATEEVKDEADAEAEEGNDSSEAQNEEEEFDYLAYAQDRALFLWGDAIRLGIIKAEELPEELRKMVKMVEY